MVSIIIKFQRCGKKNCKCLKQGKLHGPYFWAVSYKGSQQGRIKYKWVYLGKAIGNEVHLGKKITKKVLSEIFPDMTSDQVHTKLENRYQEHLDQASSSSDAKALPIRLSKGTISFQSKEELLVGELSFLKKNS